MNEKQQETAREHIFELLNSMPVGYEFSGPVFKAMLCERFGEQYQNCLVASVLRPIWDYNRLETKKVGIICIDRSRSQYKAVSPEEYDRTHSLERRVLVSAQRYKELIEIEGKYNKIVARYEGYRKMTNQQEFDFS